MTTPNPLDFIYEEDITGVNPANRVTNEIQYVTSGAPGDFNVLIPKYTPFFRDSVQLVHVATGRVLVDGEDWLPGYCFYSASHETEWVQGGIYGGILLMNPSLTGQFRFERYQTLGGSWLLSNDKILEILSNRLRDPRTAYYEQVSGKPNVFPPTGHNQPTNDITGFSDVIVTLNLIARMVAEQTQSWLDNPPILMGEYYTKAQTDLQISTKVTQRCEPIEENVVILFQSLNSLAGNTYTKAEADARFAPISLVGVVTAGLDDRYTKAESDAKFATLIQLGNLEQQVINLKLYVDQGYEDLVGTINSVANNRYTKVESDARYAPISLVNTVSSGLGERYTKTESDARFAPIALVNTVTTGLNARYTKTEADARFATQTSMETGLNARYTKTESDARYAPIALVDTVTAGFNARLTTVQNDTRYAPISLVTTVTNGLGDRYTKAESDARFAPISLSNTVTTGLNARYTKTESDARFAPIALVNTVTNGFNARLTTTQNDARYAPISLVTTVNNGFADRRTNAQNDARYAPISLVTTVNNGFADRRTNAQNDARYLQAGQGGSAFAGVRFYASGISTIIISSFNIAGVSRLGDGRYRINLLNALSNNRPIISTFATDDDANGDGNASRPATEYVGTTTSFIITVVNGTGGRINSPDVHALVFEAVSSGQNPGLWGGGSGGGGSGGNGGGFEP